MFAGVWYWCFEMTFYWDTQKFVSGLAFPAYSSKAWGVIPSTVQRDCNEILKNLSERIPTYHISMKNVARRV